MRFDQTGLAGHGIRGEQSRASDAAKHATRIAPPREETEEEGSGDAAAHHRQQDDTADRKLDFQGDRIREGV